MTVREKEIRILRDMSPGKMNIDLEIAIVARGEQIRIEAVSYTHLDVYKRQAKDGTYWPQGFESHIGYVTHKQAQLQLPKLVPFC